MPGFSSTQNSGPSVGGLSRSSITATALVANSGSRSFIQVSKTVQTDVMALEDDADRALAGCAQTQFGMLGHVLARSVIDQCVCPARVGSTSAGLWPARAGRLAWISAGYWRGGGYLGRIVRTARG